MSQNHYLSFNEIKSQLSGPLKVLPKNDYMFKALMQKNHKVLTGLITSLLHLKEGDIKTLKIINPIELGKQVDDKTTILDLKLEMNDNTIINLEIQVINYDDWPERSLTYLCRSFDNLNSGDGYLNVKPAIHIGILDFTLFEKYPEFYSTYKLLNVKSHNPYTGKFMLSVLDLTKIDIATKEDKKYKIDEWARLFKATTWEDIKMLAAKNKAISEAATSIYILSEDEKVRQQCEAREDYYHRQAAVRMMQNKVERLTSEVETLTTELQNKEKQDILNSIKSLMETMGWTAEAAMNALKIPKEEQSHYLSLL